MITTATWEQDEYDVWNFHYESGQVRVHAFIQKRPPYCDRGHYSFNADGNLGLDGADTFPRYFMALDVAIQEASQWLNWRIHKDDALPTVIRIWADGHTNVL